jgi:hypothetical protein
MIAADSGRWLGCPSVEAIQSIQASFRVKTSWKQRHLILAMTFAAARLIETQGEGNQSGSDTFQGGVQEKTRIA